MNTSYVTVIVDLVNLLLKIKQIVVGKEGGGGEDLRSTVQVAAIKASKRSVV